MILALTLALAAQEAEINCSNPTSQLENTECAAREFRDADAELNRRWPEWIAHARAADDASIGGDTGPGYEQLLRDAQRSWVTFRDAHCAYNAKTQGLRALEPLIYEDCREKMTRERIRQLDNGDKALPEG